MHLLHRDTREVIEFLADFHSACRTSLFHSLANWSTIATITAMREVRIATEIYFTTSILLRFSEMAMAAISNRPRAT